jgi:hypothetical protein
MESDAAMWRQIKGEGREGERGSEMERGWGSERKRGRDMERVRSLAATHVHSTSLI